MTFTQTVKPIKKKFKKVFNSNVLYKIVLIISSLALLATSVLPYLIG